MVLRSLPAWNLALVIGAACSSQEVKTEAGTDAGEEPGRPRPRPERPQEEDPGSETSPKDAEAGSGEGGSRRDGEAGSNEDGSSPDADSPSPAPTITLAFEPLELEGDPIAVTDFAFLPGTLELLLLEKGRGERTNGARVLHYVIDGEVVRLLGSFTVGESYDYNDCGLLSVAFDPDFADNQLVYFAGCDSFDYSGVWRYEFDPSDYAGIAASAKPVLRVGMDDAPNAWHNIGDIGFDGDGNLWALVGEKNAKEQAQDPTEPLGSVIRVRPRRGAGEEGYEVVRDNPFTSDPDKHDDIAAYGLRSPWRGTLDRLGRLWIGDVGNTDIEEINVLSAFDGTNFGWPLVEGTCAANCDGITDPIAFWSHALDTWPALDDPEASPTTRRASWVGVEYVAGDDDRYDGRLDGRVLYGDFCGGWVRAIELDAEGTVRYDGHAGHLAGAVAWDQASDGYVYAATYGNCRTFPYRESGLYRAVLSASP